ncbi:hypothetical protein G6F65_018646 [Rhizopus arrhizus]|nr:hypothetical protein G6F65_018646 [Rhizopus arrhizus]
MAAHAGRKPRHLAMHAVHVLQQAARMGSQRVARRRGLHPFDAALQEGHAKGFFHLGHALADGGRHDVFACGGAGQAAFFQGGQEQSKRYGVDITGGWRDRQDRLHGRKCPALPARGGIGVFPHAGPGYDPQSGRSAAFVLRITRPHAMPTL